MKLEEVLGLEGIKLIDTNIFGDRRRNFALEIYDWHSPRKVDNDLLIDLLSQFDQTYYRLFHAQGVFTVPGVVKEINCLREIFISKYEYLRKHFGKLPKEVDDNFNGIILNLNRVIGYLSRRDILSNMNGSLEKFEDHLKEICLLVSSTHGIIVNYSQNYECFREVRLDSHTDESLAAAAITVSENSPAHVISNDSDILRILSSFFRGRGMVRPNLLLHSDYKSTSNFESRNFD